MQQASLYFLLSISGFLFIIEITGFQFLEDHSRMIPKNKVNGATLLGHYILLALKIRKCAQMLKLFDIKFCAVYCPQHTRGDLNILHNYILERYLLRKSIGPMKLNFICTTKIRG